MTRVSAVLSTAMGSASAGNPADVVRFPARSWALTVGA